MRQWPTAVVNQRLNQPQASVDFAGGQANVMKHVISAKYLLMAQVGRETRNVLRTACYVTEYEIRLEKKR